MIVDIVLIQSITLWHKQPIHVTLQRFQQNVALNIVFRTQKVKNKVDIWFSYNRINYFLIRILWKQINSVPLERMTSVKRRWIFHLIIGNMESLASHKLCWIIRCLPLKISMNSRPYDGKFRFVVGLSVHLWSTIKHKFFQLWSDHILNDWCFGYDSYNVLLSILLLKKRLRFSWHLCLFVLLNNWKQWLVQILSGNRFDAGWWAYWILRHSEWRVVVSNN